MNQILTAVQIAKKQSLFKKISSILGVTNG